jgi:hypothetical protein
MASSDFPPSNGVAAAEEVHASMLNASFNQNGGCLAIGTYKEESVWWKCCFDAT